MFLAIITAERDGYHGIATVIFRPMLGHFEASMLFKLIWVIFLGIVGIGCRDFRQPEQFQIASSSMAPLLTGQHRQAHCDHCGAEFSVATETYSANRPLRCYACGGFCKLEPVVARGCVVRLRNLKDTDPIRRFDLVAFKSKESSETQVKRVWGLPGENLQISQGELWVDGGLLQKSLDELRGVAVPISSFPDSPVSHWRHQAGTNEVPVPVEDCAGPGMSVVLRAGQALSWSNRKPARVHPLEVAPDQWLALCPLDDDYPCNQGLSYSLQPVPDFLLTIEFGQPLTAGLGIRCVYLGKRIEMLAVPTYTPSQTDGVRAIRCTSQFTLAFCDQRLLVQTDEVQEAVEWNLIASRCMDAVPDDALVTLFLSQGQAHVARIAISRDLYLRSRSRNASDTQDFSPLPADSYFVMGDNQPASIDSRNGLGFIERKEIQGTVHP